MWISFSNYRSPDAAPWLIVAGLGIVVASQAGLSLPIAGAIAMIGWGAARAMAGKNAPRHAGLTALLNLVIYTSLACLAMAAQTDAAMANSQRLALSLALLDCALATLLLVVLTLSTVRQLVPDGRSD